MKAATTKLGEIAHQNERVLLLYAMWSNHVKLTKATAIKFALMEDIY